MVWAPFIWRIAPTGTFYPNDICPKIPATGYGTALQGEFNASAPDRGVGFNVNIPIGNKFAQSVQARSLMEYRQAACGWSNSTRRFVCRL